jgi:nucleotide-binding universal stress UspA family protein
MYKKILVPLDGSELAECVIPHVEAISNGCGVESVVFLRVYDPYVPSAVEAYLPEEQRKEVDEKRKASAGEYLEDIAGRAKLDGVKVQKQLVFGKPADAIAEYATNNGVDLITIATHGRSGVSRWAWGSVAERILRSACVPVLMVRAPGCVPNI